MKWSLIKIIAFLLFLLMPASAFAYVIIAVEQGSVTYKANENKTYNDKGRYKTYFEVDEENKTVTRTKVELLTDDPLGNKKGHIEVDNTIYQVIDPPQLSILTGEKVIHAVGQPGLNATELITISKSYVLQAKSTGDYVVLVNSKITERSNVPNE